MLRNRPFSYARHGLLALALLTPAFARAATYTVNTLADDTLANGACTLREAVALHNGAVNGNDCGLTDGVSDKIALRVGGTIYLNPKLGELVLSAPDLTIEGPGAPKLAIHGGNVMGLLVLDGPHPPALTVRAVTLRNGLGKSPMPGANPLAGGIRMNNYGNVMYGPPTTIVVEDVVLLENASRTIPGTDGSYPTRGAAISSFGSLVLRRTLVKGSEADMGAVWHDGSALVEDCEFSGNRAVLFTSSLVLRGPGSWTVRRSLFRENGGANGLAGGIRTFSLYNADSGVIENCTFAKNGTGSILSLEGKIAVRSSTFVDNGTPADFWGGAIEVNGASLEATSNLFAGNSRPDVFDFTQGAATLKVAYNLFETLAGDLPPAVRCASSTVNDYNLCGVAAPGIGNLGPNGGPTWTIPLLPGSPALNAGSNPGALTTDQRGTGHPRTLGPQTDIGAYEAQ